MPSENNPEYIVLSTSEQSELERIEREYEQQGKTGDDLAESLVDAKEMLLLRRKLKEKRGLPTERQLSLFGNINPVTQMPSTPKETAPYNNYMARSDAFLPVQPGKDRKKLMRIDEPLSCPENCAMSITGLRLGITDDSLVYFNAMRLAANARTNTSITIDRTLFLRQIGWKSKKLGQSDFDWLQQSFDRLSETVIKFDTPKMRGKTHLIGGLIYDKELESYQFSIPPETFSLFAANFFTYVNIENRVKLRSQPLAMWMQSYIASHNDVQNSGYHSNFLDKLHSWSGHKCLPHKFLNLMQKALASLIEVGEIDDAAFEISKPAIKTKVTWHRTHKK